MERNDSYALTIKLLRCALTGENPDVAPDDAMLKAVYRVSNRYDLAHCVGYALQRASLLPESALGSAFRNKQMEALLRTEQQEYERKRAEAVLEKAGIDYILLKGVVLRTLYPEGWMRTGADVDILVQAENYERAITLLCSELSYTIGIRTTRDTGLTAPSGQTIELHREISGIDASKEVLSRAWEMSLPVANKKCERIFPPEYFYVYHVLHMAKHVTMGGCGIRPFLDLWLMERTVAWDKAKADELLREAQGLAFAQTAVKLAKYWFSDEEGDPLTERLEEYILAGGAFGSVEKRVAADRVKNGGKMQNLIARAWLPYETMTEVYPPLKKRPWRLPYYEVCRWCRQMFRGSAGSVWAELRSNQTITKEKIRATEKLLKDLELL